MQGISCSASLLLSPSDPFGFTVTVGRSAVAIFASTALFGARRGHGGHLADLDFRDIRKTSTPLPRSGPFHQDCGPGLAPFTPISVKKAGGDLS